jgi:MFS family permease
MLWISRLFARHSATLVFPIALILYDFSAYLTTDLIQPGIIHVVRDFNADVALAPASVSVYMAGGMALQWLLGPLSDRIGRRPVLLAGALIFTLACLATMLTTSMTQFLVARFVQGTSICFIATVGYVTVQEAFDEKRSIKLMAVITSIVLIAPIVGPLSGAALMHFVHWKVLFGIIAAMGFIAWLGLLLNMPETVRRGDVPFSAGSVVRDFRDVFRNRIFYPAPPRSP